MPCSVTDVPANSLQLQTPKGHILGATEATHAGIRERPVCTKPSLEKAFHKSKQGRSENPETKTA